MISATTIAPYNTSVFKEISRSMSPEICKLPAWYCGSERQITSGAPITSGGAGRGVYLTSSLREALAINFYAYSVRISGNILSNSMPSPGLADAFDRLIGTRVFGRIAASRLNVSNYVMYDVAKRRVGEQKVIDTLRRLGYCGVMFMSPRIMFKNNLNAIVFSPSYLEIVSEMQCDMTCDGECYCKGKAVNE